MAIEQQQSPDRGLVWKRGLFMLLFAIAFAIGHTLLNIIAIVQFLWLLFTGEPNRFLASFGRSLSLWFADAARFLSCGNNEMPFPWKSWPDAA
jgi:hypothetical protein